MDLAQLLPWFPIILAVGVGGRLLGKTRGLFMGVLCAMFWIMLIQASSGADVWRNPWSCVTIIAGAVAIASMGRWSGQDQADLVPSGNAKRKADRAAVVFDPKRQDALQHLSGAMTLFEDWLEEHRDNRDPWPKFGEFIRSILYQCCGATHIRPFRLLSEGSMLAPLRETDPIMDDGRIPARKGLVGHVITTGRSYVSGDEARSELVGKLVGESSESVAWCFAVKQGAQRLGIVTVGHLDIDPERHRAFLRAMEQLIGRFWCHFVETVRNRTAVQIDPASGLFMRPAFLRVANEAMRESYTQGEPVAVVVIALEGLREINDSGRWEVADDLVKEVGEALRRKIRTDDRLGRFDGSRLILLLRRVDSELASLIVDQIMSRLTTLCGAESRRGATVTVRCGLAGSGTEHVDLRTLVSRALAQYHRARIQQLPVARDLEGSPDRENTGVAEAVKAMGTAS